MKSLPRAKPKTLLLTVLWLFCAFTPVTVSAAENDAGETATDTTVADDGARALSIPVLVPDRWSAPPPDERPLMDILEGTDPEGYDEERAKTVRGVSTGVGVAGLCLGTVLAASGVYRMYAAAGQGPDMGEIHDGIGIVISGSLVTAVSSMLFSAARESRMQRQSRHRETTAQE